MQTKLVLFDAAGVLFPTNTVVGDDLAARFHLSQEDLYSMWHGFYVDYTTGKMTTEQFMDMFADTYHIPRDEVTEDIFVHSFQSALTPMPGIEDILRRLQQPGLIVAMLSDTTPMIAVGRRQLQFDTYFDHMFLSFDIGYKKPDIRAYQTVVDYYRISPGEIFFTDDSADNVAAAQQFGMKAIVFTDSVELLRELAKAGILETS